MKEHHIIYTNYSENKIFELKSRIIVLGRDPSKDIVISSDIISREHATFFRTPTSTLNKYDYQIVDGGPNKIRSKNGISVNGKRVYTSQLRHGDIICFSESLKAIYLRLSVSSESLEKYISMYLSKNKIDENAQDNIGIMSRIFL